MDISTLGISNVGLILSFGYLETIFEWFVVRFVVINNGYQSIKHVIIRLDYVLKM